MQKVKKLLASLTLLSVELIIILVLFILSLLAFLYITADIVTVNDQEFDNEVFVAVRPFITDMNSRFMRFISFFASHNFLFPANVVLALYYLIIKKHQWYSVKIPVIALGSYLVMSSLKVFFSRARPDEPLFEAARGFSYPSGHAMSAMTFYGLLIYLVWQNSENKLIRWVLTILLSLFIFLIGFSRVYLRVHYASDVLAGFSMGLIWLVISIWVMKRVETFTRKKVDPVLEETNS